MPESNIGTWNTSIRIRILQSIQSRFLHFTKLSNAFEKRIYIKMSHFSNAIMKSICWKASTNSTHEQHHMNGRKIVVTDTCSSCWIGYAFCGFNAMARNRFLLAYVLWVLIVYRRQLHTYVWGKLNFPRMRCSNDYIVASVESMI